MGRVTRRPKPHIRSSAVKHGRVWLCFSVEVMPRGKPSRMIQRLGSNPSMAYKAWRLAWAEAILKVATR